MIAIVKTKGNKGFKVDLDTMESIGCEETVKANNDIPTIDYNVYGYLRLKNEELLKEVKVWKYHALNKIKLEVSE